MDVSQAIRQRRSVKKFTDRQVGRDEIERLLETAVLAPNHHLTEPWEFLVLGPQSRRAYGAVLGQRKAKKIEDPDAAKAVVEKVGGEHEKLPAMIAVVMDQAEKDETREEDYAATWMAIQNLCLAAEEAGLATHIKTGAIMDDPRARDALGVQEGRRIVAVVNVGEPAERPDEGTKTRTSAAEKTRWLP